MNELRKKIKESYRQLTQTNKLISDTILELKDKPCHYTMVELAQKSFCSSSAITKYIQYFGYTSYKVFQADLNIQSEDKYQGYINSLSIVDEYFEKHPQMVQNFLKALKSSKKIYLFAAGQSQLSAIDFSLKVNKLIPEKVIFDPNMPTQRIFLSTISEKDAVIFISNSGEARELISFVSDFPTNKVFLITNRDTSKLASKMKNIINFNNTFESPVTFKDFSRESKYTLMYFFDCVFEILYQELL